MSVTQKNKTGIKRYKDYTPKVVRRGEGSLAQVYRPMRFAELHGPNMIAGDAIARQLVRHDGVLAQRVWLISGQPGTGKTSLAMIIAMSMNCLDPQPSKRYGGDIEPCLQCRSCRSIMRRGLISKHFAFLYYDVASMRKEDIVNVIKEDMTTSSSLEGRYKFIVFEEAHNLTKQQREALLKPVENTLSRVFVMFLTAEPGKLADSMALRGRVSHLQISTWQSEDLLHVMKDIAWNEHKNGFPYVELEGLKFIMRAAEYDVRVALSNLNLVMESIKPSKEGCITATAMKDIVAGPVGDTTTFTKYMWALVDGKALAAFNILDKEFDRKQGVDARSIAMAAVKFLRRQVYKEIRNRNTKRAYRYMRQLKAFNDGFWGRDADPYSALTAATFAALEAGGYIKV